MKKIIIQIQRRGGMSMIMQTYGRVKGLIVLIDWGAQFLHLLIFSKLYGHIVNRSCDISKAFLFPRTLDLWTKYSDIIEDISFSSRNLSVLEVGSGAFGLCSFIRGFGREFVASDISKNALRVSMEGERVVCDARYLPFRTGAFHTIVCADLVEHLSKEERNVCFDEFLRVGLRKLVMHFPAVGAGREYNAREYDLRFQSFYVNFFGVEHSATKEHIERIHPDVDEIKTKFPESKFVGRLNCQKWLKYMKFSSLPIFGFLAGMAYVLFWKNNSETPPFYRCKVVIYLPIKEPRRLNLLQKESKAGQKMELMPHHLVSRWSICQTVKRGSESFKQD